MPVVWSYEKDDVLKCIKYVNNYIRMNKQPEGTGTEDRETEWVVWKCATEEMRELILCGSLSAVGTLSRGRVDVFQPSGR